ncbi:response regulator [Rhizobacter sp. AJA081-3]|uniref:response regulator n=1 Tax=Rhizobacter sp. AJA081-3 TaxID=2753607 RepID=UPI001ADF1726|nr:response regulator [Rhizobacter sp. AJA081-3]QTN22634.1 response regulator [Rhizobacter sp. AJA081-3]
MLTEADLLNAKILIVDDQQAHVQMLERLLHEAGYTHVQSTLDPLQVGSMHRENRYDLILLDLLMPGLDGFGVMEGLRSDTDDVCLPVIVLTAQPGHKLRALQAGAMDFINKPFDIVEVKIRIRHMLELRLLYKMVAAHNKHLEMTVLARTAELRESEARFRNLTALAADWYWELNEAGDFTKVSGPVAQILGMVDAASAGAAGADVGGAWDAVGCQALKDNIAARRPFLDFVLHRQRADGSREQFRISGEPMLDETCRFIGYRGVGAQVLPEHLP